MVTTLFFMWGFVTALNDVLIPHLKDIFGLSYAGAMLVQVFFFFGYFVFALPAGKLVEIIGYKKTMVTGLIVMAVGALIFIPAASVPSYPIFLVALMVLAAGMTALQVSANPYVSVLGPPQTASSRLNLTQAFNSLGTTIAPYLGGLLILRSVVTGDQFKALSAEKVSATFGLCAFDVHVESAAIPDRHGGEGKAAISRNCRDVDPAGAGGGDLQAAED